MTAEASTLLSSSSSTCPPVSIQANGFVITLAPVKKKDKFPASNSAARNEIASIIKSFMGMQVDFVMELTIDELTEKILQSMVSRLRKTFDTEEIKHEIDDNTTSPLHIVLLPRPGIVSGKHSSSLSITSHTPERNTLPGFTTPLPTKSKTPKSVAPLTTKVQSKPSKSISQQPCLLKECPKGVWSPPQLSPAAPPTASPRSCIVYPSPRARCEMEEGFVLPFAMPAQFRADAWSNRQDVAIPDFFKVVQEPLMSSRGRHIKAKEGSLLANMIHINDEKNESSEEDISDHAYFQKHARENYELRIENLQILRKIYHRKKGAGGEDEDGSKFKDEKMSKEMEKLFADLKKPYECPPIPSNLSALPDYNYDVLKRPWLQPKDKFIEVVKDEVQAPKEDDSKHKRIIFSTVKPIVGHTRKLGVTGRSSKAPSLKMHKALQPCHQMTLLKLRYLHLRKQLVLLKRSRNLECGQSAMQNATLEHWTKPVEPMSVFADQPVPISRPLKRAAKDFPGNPRKTGRQNAGIHSKRMD